LKKAVSFCLYGTSKLYIEKFFINFQLYKKYFFDYDIILHADIRLKDILHEYSISNNIIIHYLVQKSDSDGMFWRFNPILNNTYDVILIRDIDYTPSDFELSLINDFINSNSLFHIIRSDFNHKMPIMGGLFGIKKKLYQEFINGYNEWGKNYNLDNIKYNDDQLFLANFIYDKIYKASLIHTSNVIFLGENYNIINPPLGFIIGGDDRHNLDAVKNSYLYYYLPVQILKILKFRAMNYLRIKVKKL
jgi:hypothetical protein